MQLCDSTTVARQKIDLTVLISLIKLEQRTVNAVSLSRGARSLDNHLAGELVITLTTFGTNWEKKLLRPKLRLQKVQHYGCSAIDRMLKELSKPFLYNGVEGSCESLSYSHLTLLTPAHFISTGERGVLDSCSALTPNTS